MQDKGFGSFVYLPGGRDLSRETIAQALEDAYGAGACYYFSAGRAALKRIKTVYTIMKSGYNLTDRAGNQWYRRSLLFLYMHNKFQLGNEKAEMKNEGILPRKGRGHNSYTHEAKYVRALLGVGELLTYYQNGTRHKISISNAEIERLASPVFFKVIGTTVYYVGGRINSAIFGKTFTFSGSSNMDLDVPQSDIPYNGNTIDENFMDDFLEYCMRELNSNTLPEGFTPLQDFPGMNGVTIGRC